MKGRSSRGAIRLVPARPELVMTEWKAMTAMAGADPPCRNLPPCPHHAARHRLVTNRSITCSAAPVPKPDHVDSRRQTPAALVTLGKAGARNAPPRA